MGAGIAEGEWLSLTISADDKRDFEERRLMELVAVHAISGQGAIPETREHERVGGLALWEVEFGHGGS